MSDPFDQLLRSGRLPSPSGIGARILSITQDPDATVEDVADVLSHDPALTGRILGVANSARHAGTEPLATPKAAAMRLGLRAVSSIAVSFTVVSAHRRGHCEAFDYGAFWSVSMATAVAAQTLAREVEPEVAAEAFTAGLLLRIGRLGLASADPEAYAGVLQGWHGGLAALRAAERDALGLDHAELARRLADHWGLPPHVGPALEGGLRGAEDMPDGPARTLARILAAAARLGGAHIGSAAPRATVDDDLAGLLAPLGLSVTRTLAGVEDLEVEWHRLARDLELQPLPPVDETVPSLAGVAGPDPAGPLVLVVDDDPISLKLLTNCLHRHGLRVAATPDPEEALALAVQHEPSVLITDWRMPGMDGLELCRALRRCELGRRLSVIVLTDAEEEDACLAAFDAEADHFVRKPFAPKELVARVRDGLRLATVHDGGPAPATAQAAAEGETGGVPLAIDDLAADDRALGEESGRDADTGLPNRFLLASRLGPMAARCAEAGQPLTLLALGLDGLAGSDAASPLAIQDALRRVLPVLAGNLLEDDLLCVAPGARLLLPCPGADVLEAATVAERLRAAVEAAGLALDEAGPPLTVTVGMAELDADVPDGAALLEAAEAALTGGLAEGANRVHLAA